jgi:16S rRNA processing protein RimM
LSIGQIVGAHGIRGELKVEILTDDPHRFGLLERVYIGQDGEEPVPWAMEGYRLHKGRVLLKLAQCDDRTAAQAFRGLLVQVPFAEALPLQPGDYYEHQIVGLEVWTEDGRLLGEVAEILYTGANEVYVVRSVDPHQRDCLVPAIKDVVIQVDLDAGQITIDPIEGLV